MFSVFNHIHEFTVLNPVLYTIIGLSSALLLLQLELVEYTLYEMFHEKIHSFTDFMFLSQRCFRCASAESAAIDVYLVCGICDIIFYF